VRSVSLKELAEVTAGSLEGPGRVTVSSVGTDTRDLRGKDLFVALVGQRMDGHRFLPDAVRAGAKAAVVASGNPHYGKFRSEQPGFPTVVVKDTLRALGDLAAFVRQGLQVEAVGITGTTGKTCTKDYLVSILSRLYGVAGSPGSYNNEIGIPLTIFAAGESDRALVAEMGARRPGDISRLAQIVEPSRGIITNIGPGHLELFKTEEAVARTKAELAVALPPGGTLFLNTEDRWTRWIARQTAATVVRFGSGRSSDYRASRVSMDGSGRPSFEVRGPGLLTAVRLPCPGRHQVANALAAAACAHEMGVGPADIAAGLERAEMSPWRLDIKESAAGFTVINDAYNANPRSMSAALETLKQVGTGRRTIAVLGGMAELGKDSRQFHLDAGRNAALLDTDIIVTVGRRARLYAAGALEAGIPRGSVFRCDDPGQAVQLVGEIVEPGDVILVKASRVAGLDELSRALLETPPSGQKMVANV
jgi:UDP-N-acetylmuramoyl-tripeptide--D-alanyl-D-alanine ligase